MTTPNRSLMPVARALPARQQPSLPLVVKRVLPAARRTIAAAAVGLVAEYALRALANRALGSVMRSSSRSQPRTTRTVITEFVIVERIRHL